MLDDTQFISLDALANRIGLPKTFLKELADKRLIPSLDVNGRRRFNPLQVQEVLDRLAADKESGGIAS